MSATQGWPVQPVAGMRGRTELHDDPDNMQLSKNPRIRFVGTGVSPVPAVIAFPHEHTAGTDMAEHGAGVRRVDMRCRNVTSAEIVLLADVLFFEQKFAYQIMPIES